ncbi:Tim44-like domain protein [Cryptosporidium meleagridis]|uniref:Tim44-like domain protein n=1 Tax=Cryptosporidium meleagridis TaxID=93969 RepID=A0A2P4Z2K1_9CRYT|nr:Tim44-like domain protein [Cryptosporidium meleagridis]
MYFTQPNNLNFRKRRCYSTFNSYFNKFISQLKNEIKSDKILQDDIALLKKKIDNLYLKLYSNLSFRNFDSSGYFINIAELCKINRFLSHFKFFTAKISSIFSRFLASNIFSRHLEIIKVVFYDETNRNMIERELSSWKSDCNKESNSEIKTSNKKIIKNAEGETKVPIVENSVVLHNYSLRDRLGVKFKDLLFLKNIFENEYIKTIYNGNKISKVVKEMKAINPNFKLTDFTSFFEEYILPKFMESYLKCDEHKLRLHCGDVAYRQLCSNIKKLKKMGFCLNTKILQLGDVELIGAEISDLMFSFKDFKIQTNQPEFIFTFKTQQINCLQDSNGRIVSGSIDDIKELQYSIKVTPHPNANIPGLEHPYLITDLEVINSTPIF